MDDGLRVDGTGDPSDNYLVMSHTRAQWGILEEIDFIWLLESYMEITIDLQLRRLQTEFSENALKLAGVEQEGERELRFISNRMPRLELLHFLQGPGMKAFRR